MRLQRMRSVLAAIIVGGAVLMSHPARGFEGLIKGRGVAVAPTELTKLAGDKVTADKVFAIPIEKLLAMNGQPGILVMENTMYISGAKARVEIPAEAGVYGLIDVDKDITWIVMPKEKKYVEWTTSDTKALSAKLSELEAEMKKQIAKLPADKRQQIEEMMKSQGLSGAAAPGAAAKPVVKPLWKTRTVGGIAAMGYEVRTEGRTVIGWVTDQYPDLARMYQLTQERMQQMMPTMYRERQSAFEALSEHGLPVMVQLLDKQEYIVNEVTAIEQKPLAADLFTLPAGYAKTSGTEAMRGAFQK